MTPRGFPHKIEENVIFRLNSERSPKEANLLHLEWAVITQLDGEKTVGEIADLLTLNSQETKEIFQKLWKEGLLEYSTESQKDLFVPESILTNLEYELTVLLGPISEILIEDTLKLIKKNRRTLEKQNLSNFIDLLVNQISEEEKQLIFQNNVIKNIRSYIFS